MVYQIKALSLKMAKEMADAAEEKAVELDVRIVICICDNHGNMKYFRRMDGNNVISVKVGPQKALTSASIPISTKALGERNADMVNGPYGGGTIPGIILLEGGLPIISSDGQHLGGIGISGATPELDGICAAAALEKIQAKL
jgi:uncharacterized protein GlcG (DUF336 family)